MIKSYHDFIELPQHQAIVSFSVLKEAEVYFGFFTTIVKAAGLIWQSFAIKFIARLGLANDTIMKNVRAPQNQIVDTKYTGL